MANELIRGNRPLLADLEEFVHDHRPHGSLIGDATEPAWKGYLLTVACPCGVTFADLEGYERDLRDQQEQVERLRRVWGGWAAALDADVPTARQIPEEDPGRPHPDPAGRSRRLAVRRYQQI